MKNILFVVLAIFFWMSLHDAQAAKKGEKMNAIYDFSVKEISGVEKNLSEFKGKVLLIVNTASECGFTPQYAGLEEIYKKYKEQGFSVLGFPSNDFGGQEPGSEAEIKKFCEMKYKVTFPLFAKVGVKEATHPLYAFLQESAKEKVKWNFGKFLIGKNGHVIRYFDSNVGPTAKELTAAIEGALKE